MKNRFGYDGNEGIYFDRERPTTQPNGDVGEDGQWFMEAEMCDMLEHSELLEAENERLKRELADAFPGSKYADEIAVMDATNQETE